MKIKHGVSFVIAVLAVILPLTCGAEEAVNPGLSLNLEETIRIAFQNNKDIQITEKELQISQANLLGARSNFLPKVGFNGSYTKNGKVMAQNIFTGYKNDNILGFSINESLYNGGADIANFKASQVDITVADETLRAKKLDIEFESKRLYYGLLLAYETKRIAEEALDQAKAHYDNVMSMYKQGTSSRFDTLQSKVQVSLLEPDVVAANNDISSLEAELNKLLGQNVYSAIVIKEKLGYELFTINEEDFLKTAYLHKPEMHLKALGIDIKRWEIEEAKAGYRPQVNLQGDYLYRSNNTADIINRRHRNWNAGVAVNIPIFEGFSTKAKVDAAKARYAQARLDKENVADQIAVDVHKACLDLKEAEAIISSQKDNVAEAREALHISDIRYTNGVGTNLDVLDSQVSLSKIERTLAEATYDYLMAEAFLDRSLGKQYVKEAKDEKKN